MSGIRRAALTTLRTRLRGITKLAGYNTDVGKLVFLAEEPVLGPDDPEAALAIVVGTDEPGFQGEHVVVRLPVEVQAVVKVAASDPWMTIEAILEDVYKAVETDHNLGGALLARGLERGSTRPLDREPGSEYVGAGVEYRLLYKQLWGTP